MFETLEGAALESSDSWNSAGTGHAANCELNYTPERADGSIDIFKALEINVEFDLSRQLLDTALARGVARAAARACEGEACRGRSTGEGRIGLCPGEAA